MSIELTSLNWALLFAAVFTVAFFYSSVGHGGATGYLAALAVLGIAPASAKVAVLVTNVLVASVALWRFWKAGHIDWKILLWFALASVPCAIWGSKIKISPHTYKLVLGSVLTVAGLVLMFRSRWQTDDVPVRNFFWPLALVIGAGWEKISHAGTLLWLTVPAVVGALLGTGLGARRWSSVTFSRVLAAVLIFAGGKLLLEACL